MPVELSAIRDLLLPGLRAIAGKYNFAAAWEPAVSAPHIWVPKLSIPQAVLVGAVAAVIKNPEVTRRFWAGWFSQN